MLVLLGMFSVNVMVQEVLDCLEPRLPRTSGYTEPNSSTVAFKLTLKVRPDSD